ncbi:MAG: LysM peptidoglycan-binding domain-containing protein [Treponema sp.]|jgi:LysM repeat protein|nr:LysM peptidoglycan-binding domain-containing protein [Treponema sp.]
MKPKKHAVWAALFLLSVIFPVVSEERIHILQKGETIYSVARSYGASPSAVLALNGLNEAGARTVQPGYRLRIPSVSGSVAQTGPYGEYRVSKGETLYSLARRYGISLTELLDMNGFSPDYKVK